jgi:hypothetical protein
MMLKFSTFYVNYTSVLYTLFRNARYKELTAAYSVAHKAHVTNLCEHSK